MSVFPVHLFFQLRVLPKLFHIPSNGSLKANCPSRITDAQGAIPWVGPYTSSSPFLFNLPCVLTLSIEFCFAFYVVPLEGWQPVDIFYLSSPLGFFFRSV